MERLKNKQGFTLVELLITLVIIGILATISIPQYNQVIERVNRNEVLQDLIYIANLQEQYFLDHSEYTADLILLGLKNSPYITKNLKYRIDVELTENKQHFVLSAQLLNANNNELCYLLSINELGEKLPKNHCWD